MRLSRLSHSASTILRLACLICICGIYSFAATIPASTAIPVRFTHTIDSAHSKAGDIVTAQTIQAISLPDGTSIARGAKVIGHVVDARPYAFDPTPYVKQTPSVLAIHFDRIVDHGVNTPLSVSLRAMADPISSNAASSPTYAFEGDPLGTVILIGGDQYTPGTKYVYSDRDVVGYKRPHGVYARLIANDYIGSGVILHCYATDTEQSVALFSANACGLYGFDSIYLAVNGDESSGTFRLESRHDSVKIYAGSAALLQVQ
jgi:hypothetical protein